MGRTRFVVGCALLCCGCFRALVIDEQRVTDIAEQLEAREFDGPIEQVRERLLARLPLVESAANVPVAELLAFDELKGREWRLCFEPAFGDCVTLAEDEQGKVHARVECVHVERCTEWVWESLAPDEVGAADKRARDRQEERASIFEQQFTGRWAASGALWASVRSVENSIAFGARAGFRRWVDPYLLLGALFEYEHSLTFHNQLALDLRCEVSTWSRWTEAHWNLPEVSAYFYVAPAIDFGEVVRVGGRAGAGVQVVRLAPLFLEVAVQSLFAVRSETRVVFRIGLGV